MTVGCTLTIKPDIRHIQIHPPLSKFIHCNEIVSFLSIDSVGLISPVRSKRYTVYANNTGLNYDFYIISSNYSPLGLNRPCKTMERFDRNSKSNTLVFHIQVLVCKETRVSEQKVCGPHQTSSFTIAPLFHYFVTLISVAACLCIVLMRASKQIAALILAIRRNTIRKSN